VIALFVLDDDIARDNTIACPVKESREARENRMSSRKWRQTSRLLHFENNPNWLYFNCCADVGAKGFERRRSRGWHLWVVIFERGRGSIALSTQV